MFGISLSPNQMFILGVAALWVFSAAVSAMSAPTAQSSQFYSWLYKFLKMIAGDLSAQFGKYVPPAATAAVVALLCVMLTVAPMVGCTQAQKISVAQEIVNWTPVFISTADTVAASVEALDPATVLILGPTMMAVNALAPEFTKAAQAYLANPTQTNLQLVQALIIQIQQDANAALLSALKITNPTSQATATKDVNLIATIANTLLALIQSISTKAQLAAMASQVHITLARVRPYMDRGQMEMATMRVQRDLDLPGVVTPDSFFAAEAQAGF